VIDFSDESQIILVGHYVSINDPIEHKWEEHEIGTIITYKASNHEVIRRNQLEQRLKDSIQRENFDYQNRRRARFVDSLSQDF